MRLIDIVSAPWATTPEMFGEIQNIYARHVRGEKIDIKSLEAKIGAPLQSVKRDIEIVDGVAILSVEGVLAKKMNLLMQISGGTSTQILGSQFQQALDDPAVRAIVLNVDSPGGTVDGTQEMASMVFQARKKKKKPIYAIADGAMMSAAYWIASAAEQIFISSDTAAVGSIGVVGTHVDLSKREEMMGIKTTEIVAGKYKRVVSQYKPLTDEGRADIQDKVDYLYSIFVNDVAAHRGVSVEVVMEQMAEGRVFLGQQAVRAGLVDGVSTLSALVARIASGELRPGASPTAEASAGDASAEARQEEQVMDLTVQEVKEKHKAIAEALIAEGRTAGAEAERSRIKDVEAQSLPGHEALIQTLKFDGKTTGGEAAVQILAAERGKLGTKLTAIRKEGEALAQVPAAPAPAAEAANGKPAKDAPLEERAKWDFENDAKVKEEFSSLEQYAAWLKASESGVARIKKAA